MLRAKSAILVYCEGLARTGLGVLISAGAGAGAEGDGGDGGDGGAGDLTELKEVGVELNGEAEGDLYGLGVTVVR